MTTIVRPAPVVSATLTINDIAHQVVNREHVSNRPVSDNYPISLKGVVNFDFVIGEVNDRKGSLHKLLLWDASENLIRFISKDEVESTLKTPVGELNNSVGYLCSELDWDSGTCTVYINWIALRSFEYMTLNQGSLYIQTNVHVERVTTE